MKKVLFLITLISSIIVSAQPGPDHAKHRKGDQREQMKDLTPEQRAELRTKKMTLHLDLTEAQQKEVHQLSKAWEQKRENLQKEMKSGNDLTKDQKFEHKSKMLDEEIEMKRQLKSVLTEEQYAKFEKSRMGQRGTQKHKSKSKKR